MAKGTNLYEGYRSYFSRRLRYFCSAHTPLLSSPFDQSTDFLTSNATGQSNLARGSNDNNSIDECKKPQLILSYEVRLIQPAFRAAATNPLVANLVTPGTCDCLSLERRHCIYCFNKNFAQDDEGLKRRRKEIRKVINKIENPLRVKGYQVETEFVGYVSNPNLSRPISGSVLQEILTTRQRGVCECGNKANKEGPVICNWCKKAASVEDQEVALQGGEYTLLGGRRWGRFSRN
ncbi:hypothetical protein MMC12_001779 [Toensbergia leucococca]|nr:hypothetical protein [Toensbergia leucococca]